jgi:hypothetical protein
MRPVRSAPLLALLAACGGAPSSATTPGRTCGVERAEADRAQSALERCRADAAIPSWTHQAHYDRALSEVRALAVIAPQRAITAAEAQAAADAYWELLDVVSPELTHHASLDRAENAAEGLLRDRAGDAAVRAGQEAEAALGALRSALLPDAPPDPCAEAQARADAAAAAASACAAP